MKVTVATVCFNSQDTIENTIISVLEQTYGEIEYLIIDGASTDSTLDIIHKYKDARMKVVSEPDNGLYDAMNKAAKVATGDYIIYMNSGDIFADKDVISDISTALDGINELVYGNVIRIKKNRRFLEKYGNPMTPMFLLLQGKMMCHQSIFTRCDIMREYGFNTEFSITADYDFLMRMVKDKRKLCYMDVTVSIVDNVEGISSSVINMDEMRRQDDISLKKNFPVWFYIVGCPKAAVRTVRRIHEKMLNNNGFI